jgi:spermidine synthase
VAQRLAERAVADLQYYNRATHGALFALPTYYQQLVQPQPA